MLFRVALLIAVGSAALVGCGSDGDADSDPVATVAGDPVSTPAENDDGDGEAEGGGEPVSSEIEIADFAFVGAEEVAAGTTVVVTNTDSASHTWTAADGSFDSGTLGEGSSFEFTFDEAGTFDYFCNIHPTMTGTITVTG